MTDFSPTADKRCCWASPYASAPHLQLDRHLGARAELNGVGLHLEVERALEVAELDLGIARQAYVLSVTTQSAGAKQVMNGPGAPTG